LPICKGSLDTIKKRFYIFCGKSIIKRNNNITIIGLGEIGLETLKELSRKCKDIYGVDVNKKRLIQIQRKGYKVTNNIPESDIYIISVYTTQQVIDVIKKLPYKNKPLVIIESTVFPGTYQKLIKWQKDKHLSFDLVMFPHRYNPGDPIHHVFNLTRVMGGTSKAVARAIKFYRRYIRKKYVYKTTGEIAELCKPLENAYRFLEIAIAEELAILCKRKNIDFEKLRRACNTKWNINIKEARDGINGKCLPKDIDIINKFLGKDTFFTTAVNVDHGYQNKMKRKK